MRKATGSRMMARPRLTELPSDSLPEVILAVGRIPIVPMATPTATDARLALVARAAESSPFIYCVAVTGVTGARRETGEELPGLIARLRAQTAAPLAVGFGISTPAQAAHVAALADGVIVGSALIDLVSRSAEPGAACRAVGELVEAIGRAIVDAVGRR